MPAHRSHRECGPASRTAALALAASIVVALAAPAPAAAQSQARDLVSSLIGAVIGPWSPPPVAPPPPWVAPTTTIDPAPSEAEGQWQSWDPEYQIHDAELRAAPGGRRVLQTARTMIEQGTIVRGSCYDWIRTVFERSSGRWSDAFRGRIRSGPYAEVHDLQPGDWVLFINESMGGDPSHTHSAIFVGWADPTERAATMMSYPGGRRTEPGRYGTYTLTRAYRVVRMADEETPTRTRRRR
jgi:hypothetical protein